MAYPFAHEILVVDNASKDGSAEMVRTAFPTVRLHAQKHNRGFAAGTNAGMNAARGKYLLIVNPDIVVEKGGVERLIDFAETNTHVALVGPKLVNPDGSIQDSCYNFPTLTTPAYRRTILGRLPHARRALHHFLIRDFDRSHGRPVPWLLGACLLARRTAVDHVGPMDERYFLYYEDIDWSRRFWQAGYTVWYEPSAILTHFHQRISAETRGIASVTSRFTRIHIASALKYFWKWRGVKTEIQGP